MATQTDYRNYFELREDTPWYSPDCFCCAYIDTTEYIGEKIFAADGLSPMITNRTETRTDWFTFVFCRVDRRDMGRFLKAMEQLKIRVTLTVGDDYALICRMFWRDLDENKASSDIFKPRAEQPRFTIIK